MSRLDLPTTERQAAALQVLAHRVEAGQVRVDGPTVDVDLRTMWSYSGASAVDRLWHGLADARLAYGRDELDRPDVVITGQLLTMQLQIVATPDQLPQGLDAARDDLMDLADAVREPRDGAR